MKSAFILVVIIFISFTASAQNRSYEFLSDWLDNQIALYSTPGDTLYFCQEYHFKEDPDKQISIKSNRDSISKCLKDTFPKLGRRISARLSFRKHNFTCFKWKIDRLKTKANLSYSKDIGSFSMGKPFHINDTLVAVCTAKHSIHTTYSVSIWYWNKKTKEVRFVISDYIYTTYLKFR